jgi:hypothetical protein
LQSPLKSPGETKDSGFGFGFGFVVVVVHVAADDTAGIKSIAPSTRLAKQQGRVSTCFNCRPA